MSDNTIPAAVNASDATAALTAGFDEAANKIAETSTEKDSAKESSADMKASIDGWWRVTGHDHVEIVVASSEELAGELFCKVLRIDKETSSLNILPMDVWPTAGHDAIFLQVFDTKDAKGEPIKMPMRGAVQAIPEWIERMKECRSKVPAVVE